MVFSGLIAYLQLIETTNLVPCSQIVRPSKRRLIGASSRKRSTLQHPHQAFPPLLICPLRKFFTPLDIFAESHLWGTMTQLFWLAVLCFLVGAIIGSFLGVCIYRIPMGKYEPAREGIRELAYPVSILSPARSFCPQCEAQLAWHQNIPLVSWLLLRGRCASCRAAIPLRYPLVELLTGAFAVCCYLRFGISISALFAFAVMSALMVITFIDIDYMIIPDVITYPGTAIGLALGAAASLLPMRGVFPLQFPFAQSLSESLLGIALGAGTLYLVWWLYLVIRRREGLGLGDIKLLAMLGALFGYQCSLATIFVGSVCGSLVGLLLVALRRHSYSMHLSFGPYLAFAATLYIFNFGNLIQYLRGATGETIWRALQ